MASQTEPAVRKEYLKKLEIIRKGRFIKVNDPSKWLDGIDREIASGKRKLISADEALDRYSKHLK